MQIPMINKPFFEVRTSDGVISQTVHNMSEVNFDVFSSYSDLDSILIDFSVDKRVADLFETDIEYLLRLQFNVSKTDDGKIESFTWDTDGKPNVYIPFDSNFLEYTLDVIPAAVKAGELNIINLGEKLNNVALATSARDIFKAYFCDPKLKSESLGWGPSIAGVAAATLLGAIATKAKTKESLIKKETVSEETSVA